MVGHGELASEHLLRRRTATDDLLADRVVAADRRHHEGVALQPRDRRHAVAEALADALRDLLQHLGEVGRGADASGHLVEAPDSVGIEGVEAWPSVPSRARSALRPR